MPFGIFAPYRWGPEASDLEGVLKGLVKFGVSQTELSNAVVERYIGAPQAPAPAGGPGSGRRRHRGTRHRGAATLPPPAPFPARTANRLVLRRRRRRGRTSADARTAGGCARAG